MGKMRIFFVFVAVMFAAMMASAYAADFRIMLNDKPTSEPVMLIGGQALNIKVTIPAGVEVVNVKISSETPFFETMLQRYLKLEPGITPQERTEEDNIPLPELLPTGKYKADVTIVYQDADFNVGEFKDSVDTEIASSGALSGVLGGIVQSLPKGASREIMQKVDPVILPAEPKELTDADLEKLGYARSQVMIKEIKREIITEDMQSFQDSYAKSADKQSTDDIQGALGQDQAVIEKTLLVFEITDSAGKKTTVSKIIISTYLKGGIYDGQIIDVIPKTVAGDLSEMFMTATPEALQRDPVVKWSFDTVPPNQRKEVAYTVKDEVTAEQVTGTTIASGSKPDFSALSARFLLNGGWIPAALLVLAIIIMIPVVIINAVKGKKEAKHGHHSKK